MAAGTAPNKDVVVKLLRDGKEMSLHVTIAELPADLQSVHGKFDNVLKGVMVQGLTPDLKKSLDLPNRITGVIVTDIESGSPAEGVVAKNDVILEVNRKKVAGTKDYESVVSHIKSDQNVLLLVFRNGSTIYITLSVR